MTDSNSILPPELQHLAVQTKTTNNSSSELGQADFLELMMTQIQNQDPLNPMQSDDFLSQMAQFGTVNGITELNNSFSSLASSLQSSQALQASTMVGNSVLVQGNQSELVSGGEVQAAVDLLQSTSNLSVNILDAFGQTVRTLDLGSQTSGLTKFTWDGLDNNGQEMPAGQYSIQATSTVNNEAIAQSVYIYAKVDSVTLSQTGGEPLLNLNGVGQISMNQILEIL
ncbi:MAG: flagellar hook assembly protein FlgD [Pseudomonadota bacterium]